MDVQSELRQHLDGGEILLWSGQPKKGIVFKESDIFEIPFTIVWCSIAVFWAKGVLGSNALGFNLVTIIGIMFIIAGVNAVFGRFIKDSQKRRHTYYGLTQERIIIKSGVFSKSVKSIDIKTLSNLKYDEKGDGSGTIVIGIDSENAPELRRIDNVKQVYNQIIEIQREEQFLSK